MGESGPCFGQSRRSRLVPTGGGLALAARRACGRAAPGRRRGALEGRCAFGKRRDPQASRRLHTSSTRAAAARSTRSASARWRPAPPVAQSKGLRRAAPAKYGRGRRWRSKTGAHPAGIPAPPQGRAWRPGREMRRGTARRRMRARRPGRRLARGRGRRRRQEHRRDARWMGRRCGGSSREATHATRSRQSTATQPQTATRRTDSPHGGRPRTPLGIEAARW
mmetsp:Transcript_35819/g.114087  ORF Transcript_35819/g.114087 Transcript_35819/m.114087 type:complete len:222 (-) Transcript_35819:1097-1762(-)